MKKAFTLTEILVVIAIIAVLASLIFPVAQSAKARAKESACMSNLHQIYVAMQMYREDFGEYPPTPGKPFILDSPYLGGSRLRCQSKADPWVLGDYMLNGPPFNWGSIDERPHYVKIYDDCRNKRGDQFPIAWDDNHSGQVYDYQFGGAIFIIVLENGQVQRIPAKKKYDLISLSPNIPCLLTQGVANL